MEHYVAVTDNPIDAHLAALPEPQRSTLTAVRDTLRGLMPGAEECLSYGMPCFKVGGKAVAGFDGYNAHCSYFPHSGNIVGRVSGIPAWCVAASKGTLQFPIDRPLPKALVKKLVQARQAEIAEKAADKTAAQRRR
jgi:uncharacterized protein YdhG (YjbR/CyaY superfamily)